MGKFIVWLISIIAGLLLLAVMIWGFLSTLNSVSALGNVLAAGAGKSLKQNIRMRTAGNRDVADSFYDECFGVIPNEQSRTQRTCRTVWPIPQNVSNTCSSGNCNVFGESGFGADRLFSLRTSGSYRSRRSRRTRRIRSRRIHTRRIRRTRRIR